MPISYNNYCYINIAGFYGSWVSSLNSRLSLSWREGGGGGGKGGGGGGGSGGGGGGKVIIAVSRRGLKEILMI